MKRLFVILVALVVVSALIITGCSTTATPSTTAPPATSKPATTTAAPVTSAPPTSAPPTSSAPATSKPAAGVITLNLNTQTPGPAQAANYAAFQWMAKEIEVRTNGRVKIQNYYNNTLASGTDGINATINGVTDIDETVVGYYPGQFPLMSACELPVGYPSSFAIADASWDFYNQYPQVQAEFSKVKLLWIAAPPWFTVGTVKKEIKTIADGKGLTLRTTAGSKPIADALGAAAKITPITEAYELLSKGSVDGLIVAPEAYPGYKFDEIVKYQYDVSTITSTSCSIGIMNKDAFNKLQPQDQQALLDIVRIMQPTRAVEWDKLNSTALDSWLKLPGRVFNKPTTADAATLKQAMNAPINSWIQNANSKGLDGAAMLKYLQDRITYWSSQPLPKAPWVQ